MAKILLVEDDENLREIYQARLMAEGYEIVSAKDGEEALVVAKQEKPDLIIADIMMPRISGFEMLDILRNTEGMKHAKVIMLTALGQAEDKTRADKLGADRYLVKSQVTLEDIVHAAAELLGDLAPVSQDQAPAAPAAPQFTSPTPVPSPQMPAQPASTNPQPGMTAPPVTSGTVQTPVNPMASPTPAPQTPSTPMPAPSVPQQPSAQQISVATPPTPSNNNVTTQPSTPSAPTVSANPSQPNPVNAGSAPSSPTFSSSAVPGAPTVTPSNSQNMSAVSSNSPSVPTNPQAQESPNQIDNASQLAEAVKNLINGTNEQTAPKAGPSQPVTASPTSTNQPSTSPQQFSRPQAPTPQRPETYGTPRAFPTGAPTVAPPQTVTPQPAPASQPPAAETNVTKPQQTSPQTPQPEPQVAAQPDSITIKDKKTVEPLKNNAAIANSDLNDLLQKENDQFPANNDNFQSDMSHQPGQVFMPTNGNSQNSSDPNNIAL